METLPYCLLYRVGFRSRENLKGRKVDRTIKEEERYSLIKGRRIMEETDEPHPPDEQQASSTQHDQTNGSPPPHEQSPEQNKEPPANTPTPPSSPPPAQAAPAPKSETPPPSSPPPAPKASPPPKAAPPPSSPPPSSPPPASPPPSSPPPNSPPPSSPPPKAPTPSPPPHSPPPSTSSSGTPPSGTPPSAPAPPPSTTPNKAPAPSSGGSSSPSPPTDSSQQGGSPQSPPTDSQSPPASPPPPANPDGTIPTTNSTALSPPNVPIPPTVSGTTPQPPPLSSNSTPTLSPPSNLNSSKSSEDTGGSSSRHTGTVVGLTLAGVFLVALLALIFLFIRRRKKQAQVYPPNYLPPTPGPPGSNLSGGYYLAQQQSPATSGPTESFYSSGPPGRSSLDNSYQAHSGDSGLIAATKVHFTYEELMEITNGFSRQNVLGEGGFGCVYKGWLPEGRVVAVKQLKAGSGQGEKEFRAEVEIISRVHHRHLVSLVGYCISDNQRLLIYEFVPNKTLEHHLHGAGMPVLEWTRRMKIALGSAKGLAYLHEDCHPKIIHRDIKSANILLDDVFEAQVADFGLAKLTNDTNTHVSTRVMGTFGYMAPEYASSGKLTDRSDVFSFGVVLLELVTGRKPVDTSQPLGDESLVEWARPILLKALETGDLSELVDPRLEKHYVEGEMIRMIEAAAACVRHSALKRPRMAQVVRALDCEGELSDLCNGVKVGQSTAYDSGQYNEDIVRFRRTALGSEGSSEYEMSSREFTTREISGPQSVWTRPDSSDESETRAFTTRSGEKGLSGTQGRHNF
ncbi:unnamed protein product [Prunus armeniaca]